LLRNRGYFVIDLCGFVSIDMTGQGFYMSAFKNGVLLRNKMKKTGKKRFVSYLSFSAPCMAVTLFQFVT
jgi:hypothetical protein